MMLRNVYSVSVLSGPHLWIPEVAARDAASFAVLVLLVVFIALEGRFRPRAPSDREALRGSIRANLALLVFNDVMMSLLSATSLLLLAENIGSVGLLSWVRDPVVYACVAFVLLDLTIYGWHWANHRFDGLWMFHKVHHSDLTMNATTAFRLHFVEVLLTVGLKAVFILLTGVPAALVLFNEAIMAAFVMFHHTSLSVPGERWLGRVIVVPFLHRLHHSAVREEHDQNYGAVFSVWDRLFRTLAEGVPARMGLEGVGTQSFRQLLKSGLMPGRPAATPRTSAAMIAEAAYFKAERRGFSPGMEMLDWLEAEREMSQKAGHRPA